VVLYPDGATVIDRRFGSCSLLWRGVIHRGTRKASSVSRGVHIGSQSEGKRRFQATCLRAGATDRPASCKTTLTDQVKRFKDRIMIKNYVLSDMVTKATYVCLVAAAFVFIAMLLMTGMHP
jgi:hypothetical protein